MRRPFVAAALTAFLLAGLAACTHAAPAPEPAAPARRSAGADCPMYLRDHGTPVYFGKNGGTYLAGVMFGSGSHGIVFAHESDDDSCDWEPNAAQLATQGYRTLIFDFNGIGSSLAGPDRYDGDVLAAVEFLRSQGADQVTLVGASMGGTAVLSAAAQLSPQPVAVVSLSGPAGYGGYSATTRAATVTCPVLLIAGDADSNGGFAADAQTIDAALTNASYKQLLIVQSSLHGYRLVRTNGLSNSPDAADAFAAFLARYAPPA